ncbi:facilitated trehalose transporter Tret1-like [Osmia bicornis bicornis]|uniref:facilitated trehalose transporter Tret1-like n=1 Tax=Osmia bicornis bicornis TaxID=1437191 RepID=UPI0010F66E02|nr:facilitated trehalose transporter Tret1-like [Osmia bicornis bicornis]
MTEGKKGVVPGRFRQLFVALVANISTFSFGTMVGWMSPSIPQLQSDNPPVGNEPMTDEAASWLTGIMCLSAAFVSLIVGVIANRYGRKVAGCLMGLPLCSTWLCTIFASTHMHLFIARFFSGMSGGMALFLIPLYVSEIGSDEIRGMLGSLLVFLLNGGLLLGYILGAVLSYRVFTISMLVWPLLYILFFVFVPESPVYLLRRNRLDDAARSLSWLRGGDKLTAEREMVRLQLEAKERNVTGRSIKLSDLFRDRATTKGLLIVLGLFAGQQLAGIIAMISYTETIFRIAGSSLSPNGSAIIVGVIQVFGSCLSTAFMERIGRRPLFLTSAAGMGVCHFVIGIFCYLKTLEYDVASFSWIPVVALSVFMITYALGLGPGPYVIAADILSQDISSLVTTIGMFFAWSMAFIVAKLFPTCVSLLDVHGCFFLLATFCAATFVFIFTILPETKGQPRQLILDRLNGRVNKKQYVLSSNIIGKNMSPSESI